MSIPVLKHIIHPFHQIIHFPGSLMDPPRAEPAEAAEAAAKAQQAQRHGPLWRWPVPCFRDIRLYDGYMSMYLYVCYVYIYIMYSI